MLCQLGLAVPFCGLIAGDGSLGVGGLQWHCSRLLQRKLQSVRHQHYAYNPGLNHRDFALAEGRLVVQSLRRCEAGDILETAHT